MSEVITTLPFEVHVNVADWSDAGAQQHGAMYRQATAWIEVSPAHGGGAQRTFPNPNTVRVTQDRQAIVFNFPGYGSEGSGVLKIAFGDPQGQNHVEHEERIRFVLQHADGPRS